MKAILAGAMVALALVLSGCDEDIDKSLGACQLQFPHFCEQTQLYACMRSKGYVFEITLPACPVSWNNQYSLAAIDAFEACVRAAGWVLVPKAR
jgi:hypothetical protein